MGGDKDMYQVVKRDGKIVDFNINKIADAIKKAFDATKTEYNESVIDFLALKVSADFLPKIKDGLVAVEDVQDSVETVLSRGGYETVAKAYILYRKQREKVRNIFLIFSGQLRRTLPTLRAYIDFVRRKRYNISCISVFERICFFHEKTFILFSYDFRPAARHYAGCIG